jgi:hypothetical protein
MSDVVGIRDRVVAASPRLRHSERQRNIVDHQLRPRFTRHVFGDEAGQREVGVAVVPRDARRHHGVLVLREPAVGDGRELIVGGVVDPRCVVEQARGVAQECVHRGDIEVPR